MRPEPAPVPPATTPAPASRGAGGVVVGRDGWLFDDDALAVLEPARFDAALERRWIDALARRAGDCAALGARHVFMPVPDRVTLLHASHPARPQAPAGDPPTPLRRLARHADALPGLLDLTRAFDRERVRSRVYPRTGSGWTAYARHLAVRALCVRLGVTSGAPLSAFTRRDEERVLDLGARHSPPRRETVGRYAWRGPARVAHADERVTVHANAAPGARPLCVLLFGDGCVGDDVDGLAALLAALFAEVHVVERVGVDLERVARVRPDVVLECHAERRLLEPPAETRATDGAVARGAPYRARSSGAVIEAEGVVRERLLDVETYALDPPLIVQPEAGTPPHDTSMVTNEVTLLEARDARVLFSGGAWMINAADGTEVERWNVDETRAAAALAARPKRLRGTTMLLGASAGAHCYYHWMLEILPRLALLERRGTPLDAIDRFLVRRIDGAWQLETLARLGIDRSRVFETERRPHLHCERVLHVELACGINLKMPRFVPLWMRHAFPAAESEGTRLRLYVGRPPGVRRGVANESAMRPLLEAAGFDIVVMEGRTVAEQARLLARADVLIAPHGGALTNMVFCRPGTRVVELLSRHVYPYYYGLAASCGHRYHAILENPAEDYPRLVSHAVAQSFGDASIQRLTAETSFDVPLDALERMLARLDA